jgi:hypothetical protein
MSLIELAPAVRALPNPDKLRLLQVLADDLAAAFDSVTAGGHEVAIWSPFDSYDAAQVLEDALRAERSRP